MQEKGNTDDKTHAIDIKPKIIDACITLVASNSKIFTEVLSEELSSVLEMQENVLKTLCAIAFLNLFF